MNYLELEAAGGSPVELYKFIRKEQCWAYTSADEPILYEGLTYQPVVISRSSLEAGEESGAGAIDVHLDAELSIVPQFVHGVTPTPLWLVLTRIHRTESVGMVIFKGQVSSSSFANGEAALHCVPARKAMESKVPRVMYQRQCNHILYDTYCGIDKEQFKLRGTVTEMGERTVVVSGVTGGDNLVGDPYKAGFLQIVGTESRGFIVDQNGEEFTLLARVPGLTVGLEVDLYKGCDRLERTCHNRFNNIENFLGFPDVPTKNPFTRVIV